MSTFAASILPQLRELPPPLAAILLQQANRCEVMFPAERRGLAATLASLRPPRSATAQKAVASFGELRAPAGTRLPDWVAEPDAYAQAFTAVMWSSGQISAFRQAALFVVPPEEPEHSRTPRTVVVVLDASLRSHAKQPELFQRLRPVGTLYTHVRDSDAPKVFGSWLGKRLKASTDPYAHWLISGGRSSAWPAPAPVVRFAYEDMRPARLHLLRLMNQARTTGGGGGPETLRSTMMAMRGQDMGFQAESDPILHAFAADILAGGSGTQLYSTTFVQWSLREALRRARPQTMFAHFTPRNSAASMDVRLSEPEVEPPIDPAGSLVDAEMHTYMTYVNLLRLPAQVAPSMLVWHAGYEQALLISSKGAPGTTNSQQQSLLQLLQLLA